MTAMWEDKLPDGILADDHSAFLVELLADDEFLNFLVLLFLRFLFLADKWHEAFPPDTRLVERCFLRSSARSWSPRMILLSPRAKKRLSCF